jgi:hypothetical protein
MLRRDQRSADVGRQRWVSAGLRRGGMCESRHFCPVSGLRRRATPQARRPEAAKFTARSAPLGISSGADRSSGAPDRRIRRDVAADLGLEELDAALAPRNRHSRSLSTRTLTAPRQGTSMGARRS